jgi:hypothetical protein
MLKSAFDETCAAVPAERLTQAMRASIAERILKIAGTGERDPVRLQTRVLMEVASNKQDNKGARPRSDGAEGLGRLLDFKTAATPSAKTSAQ